MATTNVPNLNSSVQTTQIWLHELVERGELSDEPQAWSVLRAVLHTLRDRLTVEEAVDLAAQLPLVVRGSFYEGWRPSAVPEKFRSREEFRQRVADELGPGSAVDADRAIGAVFELLNQRISRGEIEDVRGMMPAELRELWQQVATD